MISLDLKKQLVEILALRKDVQEDKDLKNKLLEELHQANQVIYDRLSVNQVELTKQETNLRELAIEVYKKTGVKTFDCGIEIKLGTTQEIDETKALEWAIKHKLALLLDKKLFCKLAKVMKIDFVTTKEEPKAYLPTKIKENINGRQVE